MSENPLYGKKKKKRAGCANPLFVQWLTEWREEAAEKGIKTQYVYGKAIKSLKRYPLPMATGKDCKMLENFGDKICKMLDDKLAEHVALYGTCAPVVHQVDRNDEPCQQKKVQQKRPKPSTSGPKKNTSKPHEISTDEEEASHTPAKQARNRSRSGERDYIPAYRSGPYAILLTLYRNMQAPNGRGFLTKTELVTQAQPLADKSFSLADAGSRYTAWSSMGTLIKKGLVIKESSPAKYYITDAGCELAHKLEAVTADGRDQSFTGSCTFTRAAGPSVQTTNDRFNPMRSTSIGATDSFEFCYMNNDGERVTEKDSAQVLVDDDFGVGFLVHCNYQQLLRSGKKYKLDTSRELGDKVYAYLHNNSAPDCVELAPSLPHLPSINFDGEPTSLSEAPKNVQKPKSRRAPTTSTAPSMMSVLDNVSQCSSVSSSVQRSYSQDSQNSVESISSASTVQSLPAPDFVLLPGSYDIVLCIDNQEFYGAGKNGSKNMLPDLMKNGVNCDLRKLQVGDILWIAKEKTNSLPGQLSPPKSRELVLNYVIERKRMDDLVHSCTDGRLPDQKFRLKHCGVENAIFLVESHGSMQHFSMPEERLKQTITNLKVIDGFQVKRTKDNKETVAYLTVMTRLIKDCFMNKVLYASSRDDLKTSDGEERFMTFEEFNQGSVKSKALNVREMFGKQLIQIYGMSAEKAKAVTDTYPTLQGLMTAFDLCRTDKEREAMLSTIKCGKTMRNLGISQSKQIYQLYGTKGPLS